MAVALIGCAPPTTRPISSSSKPKDDSKVEYASVGAGRASRFSSGEERNLLWEIRWESARLAYDTEGKVGGEMAKVSGAFTKQGKAASTFSAQTARSQFSVNDLEVAGTVTIVTSDPPAKLMCERVKWDPKLERIEAHGKVIVENQTLRIGPIETVYASADLKEVSTPDLFGKTK